MSDDQVSEFNVISLAKKVDKLAFDMNCDWNTTASCCIHILRLMLKHQGIDDAPLSEALKKMELL